MFCWTLIAEFNSKHDPTYRLYGLYKSERTALAAERAAVSAWSKRNKDLAAITSRGNVYMGGKQVGNVSTYDYADWGMVVTLFCERVKE